jgi:hypothetical protein
MVARNVAGGIVNDYEGSLTLERSTLTRRHRHRDRDYYEGSLTLFDSSEQPEVPMYVRVVRFTDVSGARMQQLTTRVKQAGGPPPGVSSTGLTVLFDEAQRTAVVLQRFATAEDMEAGARVFAAMDPAETPGTRASVDACELKLELES